CAHLLHPLARVRTCVTSSSPCAHICYILLLVCSHVLHPLVRVRTCITSSSPCAHMCYIL
ncbi:predicted protein, partial [Nematostella vectensis]